MKKALGSPRYQPEICCKENLDRPILTVQGGCKEAFRDVTRCTGVCVGVTI